MKPSMEARTVANNIVVLQPQLPDGLTERHIDNAQRELIDAYIAEHCIRAGTLWYDTPIAFPFTRHLSARVRVYDCMDELSAFAGAPPAIHHEHRVLASVDGMLVPMPINLDTINQLYGWSLTSDELEAYFQRIAEPVAQVRTSEDVIVARIGRELYEKFFRNYTRKMGWIAARPQYSVLGSERGIMMPTVEESLAQYLRSPRFLRS